MSTVTTDSARGPLSFRLSGSTILVLLAIVSFILPMFIRNGVPLPVRTFLTFIAWPVFAVGAIIWGVINLIRWRSLQATVEIGVAAVLIWMYISSVFMTPN